MKKDKKTIYTIFFYFIYIVVSFVLVFGLTGIIELCLRIFYYPATCADNLIPLTPRNLEHVKGDNNFYYLKSDKIENHALQKSKKDMIQLYRKKAANEIRIVTCGASSVIGWTFDQQGSFPHFLQVMLEQQWPHLDIKVYNMASFAQPYQFVYETVNDTIQHSPDFLIIYSGHNELYPHNLFQLVQRKNNISGTIYTIHTILKRKLVLYNILCDSIRFKEKGIEYNSIVKRMEKNNFQWDEHIDECIEHYKYLTDKIIHLAKKNNTSLIYLTPLRNIKDFPPNKGVDKLPLLKKMK